MSLGFIGSKHTVYDVYPLQNKRVLLLVDPQNIVGETSDFGSTIATITYLLQRRAVVVIASSFGPLTGILLNLSKKEREGALDAFQREGGMGYTNFFSNLPPSSKVEVLKSVSWDHYQSVSNTGKTTFFASLSNEQKRQALEGFEVEFFPSSTSVFVDALQVHFPQVPMQFAADCLRAPLEQLLPGSVCVLENLRFYVNETSLDAGERVAMAEVLAAGIEVLVNDSFQTAHRTLASTVELPRLMQHGAAGHSMDRELAFYSKFLNNMGRPLAVVIGGSNIPEKLQQIRHLVGRVEKIFVAGPVALPFLVAKGLSCGMGYPLDVEPTILVANPRGGNASNGVVLSSSLRGDHSRLTSTVSTAIPCSVYAKEIIDLCNRHAVELTLPIDHTVISDPAASKETAKHVESTAVPSHMYSMDCGRNTISLFCRRLRECRSVVWTGSLGCVSKGFVDGSKAFAEMLSKCDVISIVGGRFTAQLVHEMGAVGKLMHVSTGSLSCLRILQCGTLPGIDALSDAAPAVVDSHASLSVHELLRNLPLFMECSSHQLKVAAKKFVRRQHSPGDYMVRSGDRHGCLSVVAQGGLVARLNDDYGSSPGRYIGRGQTVGMYEFITQAPALETVRAAQPDTVTYQVSSSVFNELLHAQPGLAAQLLHNISNPLRVTANEDYLEQRSIHEVVRRSAARTRVPVTAAIPSRASLGEDILQDVLGSVILQRLSMQYIPLVEITNAGSQSFLDATSTVSAGIVGRTVSGIQRHWGLPYVLLSCVLRNVVYHWIVSSTCQPYLAAIVGAVVSAPLRILSYGIPYLDMNFKLILDEALLGAAPSTAPLVACGASIFLERTLEKRRKGRLSVVGQLSVMAVVKLLLGLVVFPMVYQRNFVYTQPSASRFWSAEAFRAYQAKQVLSMLLRYAVYTGLKTISVHNGA